DSRFPILFELVRAAHDRTRKALLNLYLSLHGQGLAVEFVERRFGIKRIQMADTAAHEQRNDILDARLEMRWLRRKRRRDSRHIFASGGKQAVPVQQIGEGKTADAFTDAKQKIAPRSVS